MMNLFRNLTLFGSVYIICVATTTNAFYPTYPLLFAPPHGGTTTIRLSSTSGETTRTTSDKDVAVEESSMLLAEIRSMRVKEIKAELSKLNILTQDVFEKEELVQRLYEARQNTQTSKPKNVQQASTTATPSSSSSVITAPLFFASLDKDLKVAAVNIDGGITIEPSDQPYATIEVKVQNDVPSSETITLRLLLDTACSGFVLRPSVVDKYNLPKMQTPVTMTGAGGTTGATGLTQLNKFSIGDNDEISFGPLPAAVQDIGALPGSLDGIIGLSFLSQFKYVDFDFSTGQLTLHKQQQPAPSPPEGRTLVSQGRMDVIPQLGIYTVDVMLGTRGPVKMLVDTGAANTFLNWKGVENLGISRYDNSFLQRLNNPMGAMGSDNVAMQLTHRINISSVLKLGGNQNNLPGLSLKDSRRLSVDIGEIAILDSLAGQNVGGILGIDAFMRSTCVRLIFNGGGGQNEIQIYD